MRKNTSLISTIIPAKLAHAETLDAMDKLEEKAIVKLTNNLNEQILSAIKSGSFATTHFVYFTDYSDVRITKRVFDTVIETFSSKGYNCEFIEDKDDFIYYGKICIKWNLEDK